MATGGGCPKIDQEAINVYPPSLPRRLRRWRRLHQETIGEEILSSQWAGLVPLSGIISKKNNCLLFLDPEIERNRFFFPSSGSS